ncbi:MAG: DNA replication complex GINS family protein [Methanobrevibacter sp.]|nr:DNA replication complex GINS family protein [Methanobrevibacter sp.]
MDLYQYLRKIQKKERDNGTLAHVEETFYDDIHNYINELKKSAIDDPFSDVYNTLNEARRIATEICERREHKITNAAVLNMNRSYHLFSGKQEFDLVDSMPLNLTPEEETFYFSIIETLKNHRLNLSGQEITKTPSDDVEDVDEEETPEVTSNSLSDIADAAMDETKSVDDILDKADESLGSDEEKPSEDAPVKSGDEVLDRIDEISNAKVITDEKREPIEKQISKPKAPEVKKEVSAKSGDFDDIEILDNDDQFIDLDAPKRTRESEIVTILVLDEVDSIMGIDEKVYGPFRSQDIVTLPKINANIFVKNRKARFVKI